MELFCTEPSYGRFQKLSHSEKESLVLASNKIIQNKIRGNRRMAKRILHYHKSPNIILDDVYTYDDISIHHHKPWRQAKTQSEYTFDIIPQNILLFRASSREIEIISDRPTYFALESYSASTYLNYNVKGKKSVIEKHLGYLWVGYTIQPVKLLRLDDVENVNRLLRQFFMHDKKLYEVLKSMFMSIINMGSMKLYDLSKLFPYIKVSETKTNPVQFHSLIRHSVLTTDQVFVDWLCKHGFHGYSAGKLKSHVELGQRDKTKYNHFGAEIVLCKPQASVQTIHVFRFQSPTSFQEAENILITIQKNEKISKFMLKNGYLDTNSIYY